MKTMNLVVLNFMVFSSAEKEGFFPTENGDFSIITVVQEMAL